MKSKRTGILFALLMAAGMMLTTACTTEETKTDGKAKVENSEGTAKEVVDKSGKEYTSAFVCPMHCEGSGSDVAGKCPVCNMDYVANDQAGDAHDEHEGHEHGDHDHDAHEGHDHDGHDHG